MGFLLNEVYRFSIVRSATDESSGVTHLLVDPTTVAKVQVFETLILWRAL